MDPKSKILLMVDDPELKAYLQKRICGERSCSLPLADDNIVQKVFDEVPHLLIIDENFNDGEGKGIALGLKEDLVLKHIPIVLLVQNEALFRLDRHSKQFTVFQKGRDEKKLLSSIDRLLKQNYNELDVNPLTHLPGSRSSVLRIEKALDSKEMFALLSVDLSHLAAFNRAYGDARGDKVIVRLGQIIQDSVRKRDSSGGFIGHLGGDDFIIMTRPEHATAISEEIIERFDLMIPNFYDEADRARGHITGQTEDGRTSVFPIMNVSIVIIPNDKILLSEVSQISEIASRLKKNMEELPGSCYMKYRPVSYRTSVEEPKGGSVEVRVPGKQESFEVPGNANHAPKGAAYFDDLIRSGKLQTLYQPIIDLKTQNIVAYEALSHGLSGKAEDDTAAFFNEAREAGRIKELDRACVEHAFKAGQNLPPDRKLFLNVNHETLIDPGMMKVLFEKRGKIGFKNIVIEVTEQSILRSFEKIRETLMEVKEQGACVAIDDLGGGAVSLRDVAVLKPDYIKFDRSLVREIDRNVTKQQILISMIIFANGIQAVTAAEGIENKRERDTITMCGINLGQGYFFAKPSKTFLKSL